MKPFHFLAAGCAALFLAACGGEGAGRDAARTDAASPLEAEFRLSGAEPMDIDALFALMPADARPTYESAEFDDRLGATVVTNLRFADKDDGEAVVVERAEFYGVDMEAVARVRAAAEAGPDAPFETLFQKVRLLNIASEGLEDEDAAVLLTVAGVEFDVLKVRRGGLEGDGAGDEGARAANAIDLGGLYFKDIELTSKTAETPSVSFAAPDLRFVSIAGGRLGAVIANDVSYEFRHTDRSIGALREAMGPQGAMVFDGPLRNFIAPDNQRTQVKTFEWRDIDFSGLLAWGLRGEEPPLTAENLIDLGTFRAVDMVSYIGEKRAATVKETTMSAGAFTWMAPSDIRLDTKGAVYDFTAYIDAGEEEALNILADNGLDRVAGDGFLQWRWNSDRGDAALDYEMSTDGLADFSMGAAFSGLKLNEMAAADEAGEENALIDLGRLDRFSMEVADEKLLDVFFAFSALQMGGTGEDLRQSVPAMIRIGGMQAAQLNARFADYVDAVADFVGKGGALTIEAAPGEPVGFAGLQEAGQSAPQTLPDLLDLTVTHTE